MDNISKLETDLWDAADNLRANSKLTSSEYCMPVLGVIFLRHATNRYNAVIDQIEADKESGKIPKGTPITRAHFISRRALMLPKEARYDELLKLPKGTNLGTALIEAMNAIEKDFKALEGQLPKDYEKFENDLLEDLLRIFDSETLRNASGDVFGRIYEYFLMKFAMQGAQDNGEFFTPPSLVQTIVNVIEPDRGVVFDPACGSGGMFVQSSHFIERHGEDTAHRVTFFGQEKTGTTIRLTKMNLAVHGLEGDIREANTFYDDVHRLNDGKPLWANCDFVMANPPFNVDKVDAEKIKTDRRLPFGLPGVNKDKKVSNGNFLWISYFWSYLNKTGRAGFVMSSQASSAGHGEADVRRKLVETGDVDVMISIRSNFFYTRTVPCELWHFDRSKPADRRDQVLMVDARNIYRKVTRKIYDFTPEQQQNLAAIVWLYRGQSDRFIALVQEYLECTLAEAAATAGKANAFRAAGAALTDVAAPFLKTLPKDSPLRELVKERDDAAKACFAALDALTARIAKEWKKPCEPKLAAQKKLLAGLEELAPACRDLVKDVDLVFKLAARVVNAAEKDANAKAHEAWDGRAIGKLEKELDARRKEAVEQLKAAAYFERQAHWLLSRFPDAKLVAVPGLVKLVSRKEIEAADWSLTPGRYVGVAPAEVDEDFDFEQTLGDIHVELSKQKRRSCWKEFPNRIRRNFSLRMEWIPNNLFSSNHQRYKTVMELIACNFECFPGGSVACHKFGALVAQIGEVRFPVSVGERNSNQLTYDFDSQLLIRLLACGASETTLDLPAHIRQKYDFAFTFGGSRVVVEVEKANWEKILRDLLKIHIYFQNGADFALLFLPKNYPHSHGEPDNFEAGCKLYTQCLESGFGQPSKFERILLVGYEQLTGDGERFTSAARNRLKADKKSAKV